VLLGNVLEVDAGVDVLPAVGTHPHLYLSNTKGKQNCAEKLLGKERTYTLAYSWSRRHTRKRQLVLEREIFLFFE
jgi:hypothetical protein